MNAIEAIDKGDRDRALAALAALSARERRKLAPRILARNEVWNGYEPAPGAGAPDSFPAQATGDQRAASLVCTLAVATTGELVRTVGRSTYYDIDTWLAAVRALRPPWLSAEGLETLVKGEAIHWRTVELLIEAGHCERPASDKLVESMVEHAWGANDAPLAAMLRGHTGLFRDGVLYRLFEVEGGQQSSLAASDKFRPEIQQWAPALEELSRTGELDRDRLLDGCLGALSRDFPAFRAAWYARFHDRLKPSDEECAARATAYLRLTGSSIAGTVAFAVRNLNRLAKLGELTPDQLMAALPPAIHARQKGTVSRAARLLADAAGRAPAHAVAAVEVLCEGLTHPEPDVQEALLNHIEVLLPLTESVRRPLLDRLGACHDLVAPSLRDRLPGTQAVEAPASVEPVMASAPADPYHEHYALTLADTLEDALDTVAYALEHEDEPIAQELALDAIARHSAPPDGWASLAGPLRKRAETLWKRFVADGDYEDGMRRQLAYLALAWTRGEKVQWQPPDYSRKTVAFDFYFRRIDRFADRIVAGKALPLLSTPTHRGGHLTIVRFRNVLDLWRRAGEPPDPYDAVLALMRLPPATRRRARAALKLKPASALDQAAETPALRYTYEITSRRYDAGVINYYLHVNPLQPPPRPANPLELHRALIHGKTDRWRDYLSDDIARWCATVNPHDLQTYFVLGVRELSDMWTMDATLSPYLYLEPAREPWVRLGTEGHWLLMLQLVVRCARAVEVALDVAMDGVVQDRVNADDLGAVLAQLIQSGVLKPKRAAAAFSQIAAVSPRHAAWVRQVIASGLRGDPAAAPRDIGALLSLLHELLVDAAEKLSDPEARQWLESARRGGQVAKLRDAILGL